MLVLFMPWDGANPYQRELARGLAASGIRVVPGLSATHLPLLHAVRTAGEPPAVLHLHWTHGFFFDAGLFRMLLKGIRFLMELVVLKLRGVKLVWTVHNVLAHERDHSRLEWLISFAAIRLYDQLIVHSMYARWAVTHTYRLPRGLESRISVIPHGNYLECYENCLSGIEARKGLKLAADEVVFLFIGQIRPYKGVSHLLQTFRALESPRIRLIVAGKPLNGELKTEIERAAGADSRVILRLEFIPDDELQLFLNAADAVVLPYQDILTSGTVLLAMSFGRAVIAPRFGGISEVIEEGKGGLLYDPACADGLGRAMRQAIGEDLAAMGEHNFRRAQELDWMKIAEMTAAVYGRCAGK